MTMKIIVRFVRPDVKKNFNQCISKLQFMRFFLQHNTRTKKNATYCIRKKNHFATFKVYKGKCHNKHWML